MATKNYRRAEGSPQEGPGRGPACAETQRGGRGHGTSEPHFLWSITSVQDSGAEARNGQGRAGPALKSLVYLLDRLFFLPPSPRLPPYSAFLPFFPSSFLPLFLFLL